MKIKLTVRPVTIGERSLFMVAVPQRVTGTKRVRKYFGTPSEAQSYIENLWTKGYVHADFRENGEASTGTLTYWTEKFLAELYNRGKLPTWNKARLILRNRLCQHLGWRPINSITRDDIMGWQNTVNGSEHNKANHQRYVRWFFRWCVEEIEDSPITRSPMRTIKRIHPGHINPVLLTPPEFSLCLQYAEANHVQLLAWLCLGGFHGIRTEEIIRMDWHHLDWKNGYIHVLNPKAVKGWRPRHIKMSEGLRRHVEPVALPSGLILPGKTSMVVQLRLHRLRETMLEDAGIKEWPKNTLRHSFKSYHEALNGSHAETQHEMGHSNPHMTRYGYGTDTAGGFFVTKELAEEWFAL